MKLTTDDGAFAAQLWHDGKRQNEIGPMIGDYAGVAVNGAIRDFLNEYSNGNLVDAYGEERRALIPAALEKFREKNGYLPERFSVPMVEPSIPTALEKTTAQTLQRIEAKLHEVNIRITQAVQALITKVISLEATIEARSKGMPSATLAGQLQALQTSIDRHAEINRDNINAAVETRSKLSSQIGALTARVSVLNEGLKNAVLEQRAAHLDVIGIFSRKAAKKEAKQDRKAAKKRLKFQPLGEVAAGDVEKRPRR